MTRCRCSQKASHIDARAETQRGLDVLDREIWLPGPQPEQAADVPTAREARVERQGTIDQRHRGTDVLAEIPEDERGIGEDAGVVTGHLQRPPREIDRFAAVRLRVFAPTVLTSIACSRCAARLSAGP